MTSSNHSAVVIHLIDEPSALVGGTFALICAILGIIVNSITMYVIIARKSIRYHCTSPALFFLSLSDLWYSAFCLPLQAIRFFLMDWPFGRDNWTCQWFPLIFYTNIISFLLIMSLIGVNRVLGE